MAQFVVRNVETRVKESLKHRARRHGWSMEEEVREILRNAVREEETASGGLGTEIAALFSKHGLKAEIPELCGNVVQPPRFEP